ncbi:endonuclease III [Gammaproteobacteria bacterium]
MEKNTRYILLDRLRAANPTPATELNWMTPFELLTAVMLSAQTTDVRVNQAMGKLFPVANTPAAILALGEEKLKEYIRAVGLYNRKAEHLLKICALLTERHDGKVPREREALEALPGVGRKTANILLNTLYGEPTIAVDTHVFRVSNRTGFAPGKDVRVVEEQLHSVTPEEFKKNVHHWLVLHGRYVCTAKKPKCGQCVILDLCDRVLAPGALE